MHKQLQERLEKARTLNLTAPETFFLEHHSNSRRALLSSHYRFSCAHGHALAWLVLRLFVLDDREAHCTSSRLQLAWTMNLIAQCT